MEVKNMSSAQLLDGLIREWNPACSIPQNADPTRYIELYREALDRLERGRLEHGQGAQWISVAERLPQVEQYVLVYCQKFKAVWVDRLIASETWEEYQGTVTHWQPLPAALSEQGTQMEKPRECSKVEPIPSLADVMEVDSHYRELAKPAAPLEQPQGSGEPQLPQCSVCNATMQRRGDSLKCVVCEEGWTTEQPTGEPKHCSELLDTGKHLCGKRFGGPTGEMCRYEWLAGARRSKEGK